MQEINDVKLTEKKAKPRTRTRRNASNVIRGKKVASTIGIEAFAAKHSTVKAAATAGGRTDARGYKFTENVFIMLVVLLVAFMVLLLTLNRMKLEGQDESILVAYPISAKSRLVTSGGSFPLNNDKLDYTISIPAQWRGWIYKIGNVASVNGSGNSNQYLKIYLPTEKNLKANDFDDRFQEVATIIKFDRSDFSSIKNLCDDKGDKDACSMSGDVIGEKDDTVYVLNKAECPKNLMNRCNMTTKLKTSFNLK